ncbi:MAG TPA: ATP-binding protein [Ktedonobacterales bacterium]|jgi:hypothetical protein
MGNESSHLPPGRSFIERTDFIDTPFEQRFQWLLRLGWKQRTWHVIGAVPRSGKSFGIDDLLERSGASKEATGRTYLPLLVIRSPKNRTTERALCVALAGAFGVIPKMTADTLHSWLVAECVRAQVECIIIDDAQDLSVAHLRYLKELTDDLAALPHRRQVGLCLVSATYGEAFPLQKELNQTGTLWAQFRERLDRERPYCRVPGHTEAEVHDILGAYEELYRDQFPDLHLRKWTKSIYTCLTDPALDPRSSRRVVMYHLSTFVRLSLKRAAEARLTNVDKSIMETVANLMTLRRDEVIDIDEVPLEDEELPGNEVTDIDGLPPEDEEPPGEE